MFTPPVIPGVELERELGHGAYSVVLRARLDGTPCAVKLPRVRGSWTRWVYREAVALARVRDPGLPAVLEVGEVDGLPYLVMELVEGETLAETLATGPLSLERTLDLARELGRTLAAVHDAGLVHRDVKPANVVLDATGRVRLVDFGFATSIERLGGGGDAAGTPAYAAPEQLADPSRVDGRADLFALGRVLHECVAGARPPDDESGPRALVAGGIPAGVRLLLDGLLARDPDDRYPDARALLADVARVTSGQPPQGPDRSRSSARARPFVARTGELDRVWQVTAGALRGSGTVAVLRGARGGGKSRLLEALVARWPAESARAVAACHDGDAPLAALRRILESLLEVATSAAHHRAAALRAAAGDDLAPLARLIAPSCGHLLATPEGAGAIEAGTFAEGAAELLVRLAREAGPLLVIVDDLQWIDPISLEVLVCLAHRAHDAPLALVLATRPRAAARVDRLAEEPGPAMVVDLVPLDLDQIGALVASHLATEEHDDTVLRRVAVLSDHTPLGVLEVLGALLDRGALRPHRGRWRLDAARAARITLPEGAGGLVAQRLAELPPATHAVLEVAAILGTEFADGLLARALGLLETDVAFALAAARRAGLVERRGPQHRFVHDTVRESLLQAMPEARRRDTHQRIAEVLEDEVAPTVELLCAKATHYAEGGATAHPRRAFDAALAAAHASIDRFDNETGLRFFGLAEAAAARSGSSLKFADQRSRAEAHLRLGELAESRGAFEAALAVAGNRLERAQILARIAWVAQAAGEPERAWSTLERAFELLGQRLPREDLASAATTARHVLKRGGRILSGRVLAVRSHTDDDPTTTALLCDLHYQNARLALEHGKPMRLLESTLQAMDLGERAGAARAHAGARALMGLVLTAMGRSQAGAASVEQAAALARAAHDPVTEAFCAQARSVIACWSGDFEAALKLVAAAVDAHGHWLEVTELAFNAGNSHSIQSLRGRPREALAAIGWARDRLSRSSRVAEPLDTFVAHRERASRVTLGTHGARVEDIGRRTGSGLLHLGSWGSRVLTLVEADDLGPRFEALVREFEAERHNPRTAHLVLVEYFIAVAHGRVEQVLSHGPAKSRTRALRRAVDDLRACAKLPLFRAHLLLVTAHLAHAEGRVDEAWDVAHQAERLASEQSCPWVLHGVARARAHWLRKAGHHAAALDHARTAHALATEHGAASRAERVAREFGLVPANRSVAASVRSTSSHRSHRARRQLAALLQIARSGGPGDRPEARGEAVLDELLRAVDGERAELLFQPDPGVHTRLVLGRTRRGESSFAVEGWRSALLTHVRDEGEPWPGPAAGQLELAELPGDPGRVLVLPLQLYGRTVGAVGLERSPSAPVFTGEDCGLLTMLAQQVPLALEIGRLLAEREQLQLSLQQVQKMEAVGQLAGGVAHDFNNMLTAIQSSLDTVAARIGDDGDTMAELAIASDAVDRAAQLTRRLLTFSRHQPVRAEVCEPNELLTTIAPMVRRLIGSRIVLELDLDATARAVTADRSAFEQALVNLAVNARDAMPAGGTLTVSTRNVHLDEAHVRRGAAATGEHVTIAVRDEGHGMTPDVVARVFEPFYTTKGVGTGTGLGLTMVYAFVKNCGGFIEVQSEAGAGTTFLLHLPRAPHGAARTQPPPPTIDGPTAPPPSAPRASGDLPSTVLVIDDEKLVSRSLQKMLQRRGYRVLVAHDAEQALDLVEKCGPEIGLVIVDVVMPGMSGPELGRRFAELQLPAKLLYVSGFAPESLPGDDDDLTRASFLQKPFAPSELLERVDQLLVP